MTCLSSLRAVISLAYGLFDELDAERLCLRPSTPVRLSEEAEVDAEELEDAEEMEVLLAFECCSRLCIERGVRFASHFWLS